VICYRSYQGTTFAAYVQIQQTEFMAWWMIVLQDLKSSLSSSWLILIVERLAWWRIETRRSISSDVLLSLSLFNLLSYLYYVSLFFNSVFSSVWWYAT
jgi:hypothetical protein